MSEVLSADIIAELRSGNSAALRDHSVFAACLLPLVSVLDNPISVRDIAEALPHYSFKFNIDALRSIFARLGYKTEKKSCYLDSVEARLTPCIFIDSDDQVYVIYQRKGDRFVYFNASESRTQFGKLEVEGDAYLLNYCGSDMQKSRVRTSWFWGLMNRFTSLFKHLLGISLVLNLTTLCVPLFIMVIYDFVIGRQNIDALPALALGIITILGVDLALRMLRARMLAIPAGRLEYLLGTESLRQILSLPSAMTDRASVSVQLSKLRLYDSIRDFFTGPTALLLLELPFIPIFIVAIGILGGPIAVVPLFVLTLFFAIGVYALPRLKKAIDIAGEARTEREQLLMETLSANLEIKAMSEEEGWIQRLRECSGNTLKSTLDASQAQVIISTLTQGMMTLAAVAVLAIGGTSAINAEISVGALIAIMAILWRVIGPMQSIFLAYVQFVQILRGIKGLDELMALKPERNASKSSMLKADFNGDIRFERVSFRYGANLDPVLIGANFHISAGELVVIVGHNGSGKSTILKLLCGMYHAQAGNIFVDNTEIRQLNVNELRRIVGYVPQHPRLFFGDIAHNLRLGDILASDDDLRLAAAQAGILNDIEKLPEGFHTRIGDQSTDGLPTGLKRSLCTARAFLRDSPILILDEPDAAQDKTSVQQLVKQLESMKGSKTVVTVSHIPQILKVADKVIVMERGSVKGVMTPEQYLMRNMQKVAV